MLTEHSARKALEGRGARRTHVNYYPRGRISAPPPAAACGLQSLSPSLPPPATRSGHGKQAREVWQTLSRDGKLGGERSDDGATGPAEPPAAPLSLARVTSPPLGALGCKYGRWRWRQAWGAGTWPVQAPRLGLLAGSGGVGQEGGFRGAALALQAGRSLGVPDLAALTSPTPRCCPRLAPHPST